MNTVHIVDASHYQSTVDFATAKAAGLVGVIHKATQGTSYVDPTFKDRKRAAAAAGLPFASYHFLEGGDIEQQIDHYLNVVNPAIGERVVLDHEADATLDELKQAVQLLLDDQRNLQVTIYSGHLIKDQLTADQRDDVLAQTSLWIAQYTTAAFPSWPKGTWPVWSLWQFTDSASYPGFTGRVDANTFNGSREACARWIGPAPANRPTPAPAPAPTDDVPTVTITIEAPANVNVVVKRV